jgi:pentatricopeptide repeat protein
MTNLQSEINNINKLDDINKFNNLLKKCASVYELEAVVYIFDYMKQHKYKPDERTYKILDTLHSKKIEDKSSLIFPTTNKRKLQPKRRIHKIMKGYNYSMALKNKDVVINYLTNHEYNYDGKDKKQEKVLINVLKVACKLPVSDIRHILTYLKRQKYFT